MADKGNLRLSILSSSINAKRVKTTCERLGIFDRPRGVHPCSNCQSYRLTIPTTINSIPGSGSVPDVGSPLPFVRLFDLGLEESISKALLSSLTDISDDLQALFSPVAVSQTLGHIDSITASPLAQALLSFKDAANVDLLEILLQDQPRWEHYGTFVLFGAGAFESASWTEFLHKQKEFFKVLSSRFKASHLAVKNPIPRGDVMRRPKIIPLYGKFSSFDGPPETVEEGFDEVYWAEASQTVKVNSTSSKTRDRTVHYIWAPMYTMYSRGNGSEKARTALFPNVQGSTIVDLYAGIGYWAFPYFAAGAERVYACEINPFSAEGLRRGATRNGKIPCQTMTLPPKDYPATPVDLPSSDTKLVILPFSNHLGLPYYDSQADHVNLGLLPDARDGLWTAVCALKPTGGRLHLHEEIREHPSDKELAIQGRQRWGREMRSMVEALVRKRFHLPTEQPGESQGQVQVELEWVEKVKGLAKDLSHVVGDILVVVHSR